METGIRITSKLRRALLPVGAVLLGVLLMFIWIRAAAARPAFSPGLQTGAYDFSVSKNAIPSTFLPPPSGSQYIYLFTIAATDYVPGAATAIYIDDRLPTGVTWEPKNSGDWECLTLSTNIRVTCLYTNTNKTAFEHLLITVDLDRTPPGEVSREIVNTVTVNTIPVDRDTANNSSTVRTFTEEPVDLSIRKSVFPVAINTGSLRYTLTYSNTTETGATGVVISDTIPSDLEYVTADPEPDFISPNRKTFQWNTSLLELDDGIKEIEMTVTVPASALWKLQTNSVRISSLEPDLNRENNHATVSITPGAADFDFTMIKEAIPTVFLPGGVYYYRLSLITDQYSPGLVNEIYIDDPLPQGVSWTPVNFTYWECTSHSTPERVKCYYRNANSASFVPLTVRIELDRRPYPIGVHNRITNIATVYTTPEDRDVSNNSASLTTATMATDRYDFEVTKAAIPSAFLEYQAYYQFSIYADDYFAGAAAAIYIDDPLPDGVTWDPTDSPPWNCLTLSTVKRVTCLYSDTDASTFEPLLIQVDLDRDDPGAVANQLVNTVTVVTIPEDRDTTNNSATLTTLTTDQIVDLSIRKSVSPPIIDSGPIEYTLTYSNTETTTATGMVISDTIPADLEFISADPPPDVISSDGKTLHWNVGNLSQTDGVQTIEMTVNVPPNLTGKLLTNTVRVSANEFELKEDNNTAAASIQPGFLLISKASASEGHTLEVGDMLIYEVAVRNPTTTQFNSVIISDMLQPGLDFVSATFGVVYDAATRTASYTTASFPANSTITVRIQARISPAVKAAHTIQNTAGVSWVFNNRKTTRVSNPVEITAAPVEILRTYLPWLLQR